jgi:hypothetical protein
MLNVAFYYVECQNAERVVMLSIVSPKYSIRAGGNGSDKYCNFLQYGNNYSRKKFYRTGPQNL